MASVITLPINTDVIGKGAVDISEKWPPEAGSNALSTGGLEISVAFSFHREQERHRQCVAGRSGLRKGPIAARVDLIRTVSERQA